MSMTDKTNMVFQLMINKKLNQCKMKFNNKKRKLKKLDPNGSKNKKLLLNYIKNTQKKVKKFVHLLQNKLYTNKKNLDSIHNIINMKKRLKG